MIPDENVKLPTLKRRLATVRLAQSKGTPYPPFESKRFKNLEYSPPGLLVSEEWLHEALEKKGTRA